MKQWQPQCSAGQLVTSASRVDCNIFGTVPKFLALPFWLTARGFLALPPSLSLALQGLLCNCFMGSIGFYDTKNRERTTETSGGRKEGQEARAVRLEEFPPKHKAKLHREGMGGSLL